MKLLGPEKLPPNASPELRMLFHLNERLAGLTMLLTSEAIDNRAMLNVILDILREVLSLQGWSNEQLDERLTETAIQRKKEAESFVQVRMEHCSEAIKKAERE